MVIVYQGCRLARLAGVMLVGVFALAAPAFAHEIGTTRVVAHVEQNRAYTIHVTTDASVLLARLELARNLPRTTPASAVELQRGFDALCDEVTRHVLVTFDEVVGMPSASCLVDRADSVPNGDVQALGVSVTLRGPLPSEAKAFRWRYDLTFTSYALTVSTEGRAAETVWLEGGEESRPLGLVGSAAPTRASIARNYFELGFVHILPKGLDHILFVLGIFLLNRRLRPILWQVSAFTLAHSITLGLTLYGAISLPSSIVEPMIALSIVYVAVENVVSSDLKPWRVALVFTFGLVHGMGFAGVLRELALPGSEFLTGLLAFNAGVESGQLAVILSAFLIFGYWARNPDRYRRLIVVPASAAIALTGLIWTVERLAS